MWCVATPGRPVLWRGGRLLSEWVTGYDLPQQECRRDRFRATVVNGTTSPQHLVGSFLWELFELFKMVCCSLTCWSVQCGLWEDTTEFVDEECWSQNEYRDVIVEGVSEEPDKMICTRGLWLL